MFSVAKHMVESYNYSFYRDDLRVLVFFMRLYKCAKYGR
jgi:hypothetical protein